MGKFVAISSDSKVLQDLQEWASKNRHTLELYTEEEWEDIENKIIPLQSHLPGGINPANIKSLKDLESQAVIALLTAMNGNITKVSQMLKVGRATIYRKIRDNDINVERMREQEDQKKKLAKKAA